MVCVNKSCKQKCKVIDYFHPTIFISLLKCQRVWFKKSKFLEDEQTLAELNSAHCRSQAKCQLAQFPQLH